MKWINSGYSEAVIGTRHLAQWIDVLTELGDWKELYRGPSHDEYCIEEVVLGVPDEAYGRICLQVLNNKAPQPVRHNAATWDTGGLFDIDIRVRDVRALRMTLLERRWREVSAPIDWQFGDLKVREWLAIGPDHVIVAFIQRLHPPLETGQPRSGFSHAFNSSQTVRDMGAAIDFYESLGFSLIVRQTAPLAGRGGEVIGLEPEEAPGVLVDLAIVSADGEMNGSVELVSLPEKPGRVLTDQFHPVALGLCLLRFPVQDLTGLRSFLVDSNIHCTPLGTKDCARLGRISTMRFRSPEGAWLECYEPSKF